MACDATASGLEAHSEPLPLDWIAAKAAATNEVDELAVRWYAARRSTTVVAGAPCSSKTGRRGMRSPEEDVQGILDGQRRVTGGRDAAVSTRL